MLYRTIAVLFLGLITANTFADTVSSILLPNLSIPNGCIIDNVGVYQNFSYMLPVYEPNTYTCEPGYYLSADAIECAKCPSGSYCIGGTYTYSEINNQGISECPDNTTSSEGSSDLSACNNNKTCEPGTFLPANSLECAICTENNYCSGGTYTPTEQDVGIENCPEGLVAPEGTIYANECGKKLQIKNSVLYLTSVKETSPALAVRFGDNIYYARTTPVSDGVKPMNKDTTSSLRVKIRDIEYSIHDNTIKGD